MASTHAHTRADRPSLNPTNSSLACETSTSSRPSAAAYTARAATPTGTWSDMVLTDLDRFWRGFVINPHYRAGPSNRALTPQFVRRWPRYEDWRCLLRRTRLNSRHVSSSPQPATTKAIAARTQRKTRFPSGSSPVTKDKATTPSVTNTARRSTPRMTTPPDDLASSPTVLIAPRMSELGSASARIRRGWCVQSPDALIAS